MPVSSGNKHQADIERLLALAGRRDAVPAERLERMRAAAHEAWTAERNADAKLRSNRLLFWTALTAAAAVLVIAVARTLPDARGAAPTKTPAAAPVLITTGPAEHRSVRLPGGGELRVDASSAVTMTERHEIHISKGALYLDSKGTTLPAVVTPAGRITNIGTRFEVRLLGDATRVRVRDGRIRLTPVMMPGVTADVAAAQELLARADTSIASMTPRQVLPFGAEWEWVARAAPRFELEGTSLGSFLDWIEREGAWTITFASPALERRARSTVLHGSIENMSTTEALEAILPACGLVHRVNQRTGRVAVTAEGSEAAGR